MIFEDKFVALAKEIFQEKKDLEAVIATLKEKGANQMQTTQAICRGLGMKLAEVDNIVLNSPSWSEQRDYNIKVRDHFFNDDKS
jgi:hypothetical protein